MAIEKNFRCPKCKLIWPEFMVPLLDGWWLGSTLRLCPMCDKCTQMVEVLEEPEKDQ
jgi:hypothetical protein